MFPVKAGCKVCKLWSCLGGALVHAKAITKYVRSGASWEGLWHRPRLAATGAKVRATW